MIDMTLHEYLIGGFPKDQSRPAFLLPDGSAISYGELVDGAGRVSGLLISRGVKAGDRVAFQGGKCPEAVMLYLGVLLAGGVFVPLNTGYTPAEVDYFLADSAPSLFVRDARALVAEAATFPPRVTLVKPDDLASLIYTSGTTGRSKGAMISHRNLVANAEALIEVWGYTSKDVLLHALPIFHVHGLFISMHCALACGAPMLWLEKFDEAQVLAALPKATVMMGVPTFYTRLLETPEFTAERAAHVRLFISGSAPLLASTFLEFEERTGKRILERYGMSEASVIASNPLSGERVPGSVGYALPGVELRIGGGEEVGVLEIKGPSVFSGYWQMPEKTAQEFTTDGYFITGDVGRQDPDGRVWISGRAKDLIISGGFNVYPKEIELALDDLPGIVESAVIGCPHPDFGEGVVAVVIGEGQETTIIAAMRERLAAFKTPKRVLFVAELPRNAMGKVQKNLLRERYADLFKE